MTTDQFDLDFLVKAASSAGMSIETIHGLLYQDGTTTPVPDFEFLAFAVGNWTHLGSSPMTMH